MANSSVFRLYSDSCLTIIAFGRAFAAVDKHLIGRLASRDAAPYEAVFGL